MLQRILIASALAATLAACSTPQPPAAVTPTPAQPSQPQVSAPSSDVDAAEKARLEAEARDRAERERLAGQSIYFDFDSNAIKSEYQGTVAAHADFLKKHAKQQVQIQGNTDARGSREYNLALGQRRAESVKKAMEVLGVPEQQVEAVSFGKEKPRANGNSEQDYAENRRADVSYGK